MTLEKRIERLERQSRLYRNLFVLAALIVVALVTWGQARPVPEKIEAGAFVVIDREKGMPVAVLGQRATGGALDLMDRNTNRVVHLDVEGNGTGQLRLCAPGGAMRRECATWNAP